MQLLIIAPHPDDEAIASGGLIAYAREHEWSVTVLVMAIGECRQLVTGHTEPKGRIAESAVAAELGKYETKFVFVGDEFMHLDGLPRKQLCDKIEDVLELIKPDVVIVPPVSSYDQDHRAVAEAAITALRPRPVAMKHFVPVVLEADEPYWWRIDGMRPAPTFYVPLTREMLELKIRLVQAYASQDRADPFGRSVENLRRYASMYGAEIGVGLAEAYRSLRIVAGSKLL